MRIIGNCKLSRAAQWLSGRVVNLRVRGCGSLEPNQSITLNTFTAKRDCSRIYLSLPNATKVII